MEALDLATTKRMGRNMRGEVFRGQNLVGVDLSAVDLREARFEEVQFISCNLAGADLRGAQFILCMMRAVVLREVLLGDNRFYGTTLFEPIRLEQEARRTIERFGGVFPVQQAPRHLARLG